MNAPFFSHSFHSDEISDLQEEKCEGNLGELSEENSSILETSTPVTCGYTAEGGCSAL